MRGSVDISAEMIALCEKLGIERRMTAEIVIHPTSATAVVYAPNENGKPYIDRAIGEAVKATLEFAVIT